VLISHLADLHFAPTPAARANLRREGVRENVFVVGNTVVDALQLGLRTLAEAGGPTGTAALDGVDFRRPLVLVTLHRRESWGVPLQNVCRALAEVAQSYPEVEFVYPIHPNPQVREPARRLLADLPNVRLLDPLGYPEFLWVLSQSVLVLTDSGGVVEEAATLGIPTLVAREETERAEAIAAGQASLVGSDRARIVLAMRDHLRVAAHNGAAAPRDGETLWPVFGDGRAAERIVRITKRHLGLIKRHRPPIRRRTYADYSNGNRSHKDLLLPV
jgi:UDP-N-acetylglucosamine 2-epimerase (non-hydrolysing)